MQSGMQHERRANLRITQDGRSGPEEFLVEARTKQELDELIGKHAALDRQVRAKA